MAPYPVKYYSREKPNRWRITLENEHVVRVFYAQGVLQAFLLSDVPEPLNCIATIKLPDYQKSRIIDDDTMCRLLLKVLDFSRVSRTPKP